MFLLLKSLLMGKVNFNKIKLITEAVLAFVSTIIDIIEDVSDDGKINNSNK